MPSLFPARPSSGRGELEVRAEAGVGETGSNAERGPEVASVMGAGPGLWRACWGRPPLPPPPKQELSLGHHAPLLASCDADTTRAAGLEVAVGEGRAAPPSPPRREVAGGPSPPPGASLHAAPVVISCDSAFPTGRGCEYSHFTEREPEALSGALPRSRCRPERGQQASPRDAAGDGSPE